MMHFITIFWLIKVSNGIVLLLVAQKIRSMIIAFQLTFFALIVTSSILWIVYLYLLLIMVGQVTKILYFSIHYYGLG